MVEVIPFLRIFNLLNLSNVLSKRNKREPIENNDLSVGFLEQSLSTEEGRDSIVNVCNFYQNEFIDGVEGFDDPSTLETYLHDYETCLEVSETYYTFNCSYYRNYYDSEQIREHARIAVTAGHQQLPDHLERICDSYKILTNCYDIFKEKPNVLKGKRKVAENEVNKIQCFYTCNCPMTCLDTEHIDVDALIWDDVSKKSVKRRKFHEAGDSEQVDLLAADLSDKLKQIQELKRKKKNKGARKKERKELVAEMKRAEDDRGIAKIVADFVKSSNLKNCETSVRKLEPSPQLPEGVLQRDPAIADIKHGSEYVESIKKIVERKKALRKNSVKTEIIEEQNGEKAEISAEIVEEKNSEKAEIVEEKNSEKAEISAEIVEEKNSEKAAIIEETQEEGLELRNLATSLVLEARRQIQSLRIMGMFQKLVADTTRNDPFIKTVMEDTESDVNEKFLAKKPDQNSPEADTIDSNDEVQTIASHEPLLIFLEPVSEECTITPTISMDERSTRNDNKTVEQEVDAAQKTRPTTVAKKDTDFGQLRRRLSKRGKKKDALSRKRKYEDVEDSRASGSTQPTLEFPCLNELILDHLPTNDSFEETDQNQRPMRTQPLLGQMYVEDYHQGGPLITINGTNIRNHVPSVSRRVHERVSAEYIPLTEITDRLNADRFRRCTTFISTDLQRNVIMPLIEIVGMNRPDPYHSMAVLLRSDRALVKYIDWSVELRNRTNLLRTMIDVDESRTIVFHPMMIKLFDSFRRIARNRSTDLQRNVEIPLIEDVGINRPDPYHSMAVLLRSDRALVEYIDWSMELRNRTNIPSTVVVVNEPKTLLFHPLIMKLFDCFRRFVRNQSTDIQRNVEILLIEDVGINRPDPYHSMAVLLRSDRALVKYIDWSLELRNRNNLLRTVIDVDESRTIVFHPMIIKLFDCHRRFARNQSTDLQRNVEIPLIEDVGMNRPDPYHSMAVLLRSDRALVEYIDWSMELRNSTNIPSTVVVVDESRTIVFHPMIIKLFDCHRRFARNRSTDRHKNVENPLIEDVGINRPDPYNSMAVLLRSDRALVKYIDWSVELRNRTYISNTVVVVNEPKTLLFHPMIIKLFDCFRRFARNQSTDLQRNVEIPLIEDVGMNRPDPYHSMAVLLRSDRALVEYIDWSMELRNSTNIPSTVVVVDESRTIVFHPMIIKLFDCHRRFARNRSTDRHKNVENPLIEDVGINRPDPYHSMAVLLRSDRALVKYIDWSVELRNRTYISNTVVVVNEPKTVLFHPMIIKLFDCFRRFARNQSTDLQRNVEIPLIEDVGMNRPDPHHSMAVLSRSDRALVKYTDWSVELRNRTNISNTVVVVNGSKTVWFHPVMIKLFDCFRRLARNRSTDLQRNVEIPLIEDVEINRPDPYHSMAVLLRSDRALVDYIDWSMELRNSTNIPSTVVVVNEPKTLLFHPLIMKLFDCFRRFVRNQSTDIQRNVEILLIEDVGINRPDPYHSMAVLLRSDRALVKYIDWSVELRNRTYISNTVVVVNEPKTVLFHPMIIKLFDCFRRFARNQSTNLQRNVEIPLIEDVGINRPDPYNSMAVLLRSDRALVEYIDWTMKLRNRTNIPSTVVVENESERVWFHAMVIKLFDNFRRFETNQSTDLQRNVIPLIEDVEMNRPDFYHSMAVMLRSDRALVKYIDWSAELCNRTNIPSTVVVVNELKRVWFHPVMIKLFDCFRRFGTNQSTGLQRNVVIPLIEDVEMNRPDPYHSMAVLLRSDRALVKYIDWSVEFRNRTIVPSTVVVENESERVWFHAMVIKLFDNFRRFETNQSTGLQRNVIPLIEDVEMNRPDFYHSMAIVVFHPAMIEQLDCFRRFVIRNTEERQRRFLEPRRDQALVEYKSTNFTDLVELDGNEQRTVVFKSGIDWKYEDLPDSLRNNFTESELLMFVKYARLFESKNCGKMIGGKNRPEPYHSKAVLPRDDRALVAYTDWSVEFRSRCTNASGINVNESRIVVLHPVMNEILYCFRRFAPSTGQRNVANPRGDRALLCYTDWSVELRFNRTNISRILMARLMLLYLFHFFDKSPETTQKRNSDLEEIDEIACSTRVDQTISVPIERNNIAGIRVADPPARNVPHMNGVIKMSSLETRAASTEFERNLEDCVRGLWNIGESDDDFVRIVKRCGTFLILMFLLGKAVYLLDLLRIDVVFLIVLFIYLCVQFVIRA